MSEADATRRAGVIGGMGPEATLAFLEKFYALTRGRREQDRPALILDMDPGVPDRNAAWRGEGVSPAATIARMGRRLERAGADFCVMPCVTAHGYTENFEEEAGLPLLALPPAVAETLAETTSGPVGLLATTTTLEMKLFQHALTEHSLPDLVPEPDEQETLMRAIYAVKKGDDADAEVGQIAESLVRRGAKVLLVGCTDLSALSPPRIGDCIVVDALDVLASRTLAAIETPGH